MPEDNPADGSKQNAPTRKRKSKRSTRATENTAGSSTSPWFVFTTPMTAGSSVDHVTRDQIRRQAAHASSAQRVSTIQRMKASKAKDKARALHPSDQIETSRRSEDDLEDRLPPLRRAVTDLSRRSSIAPSPTESYSLSRSRTPFSAPSSPREVLGAGRVDPFLSYPTENRDPIIPSLVDHFLVHFAPAPSLTSNLHGRDEMRLQLWPEVLRSRSMFDAVMLFTGTHLSICRDVDPGIQKRQALWLRQTTLNSINTAISGSTLTTLANDTIAAIAMLASWELEFGERANFDIHMRVLRDVIAKREGGRASLPPAIWNVVLTAGKALPSFASHTIYFDDNFDDTPNDDLKPERTSIDLTPGFASLREKCLVQPRLCGLIASIHASIDDAEENASQLESIYHQLLEWDPYKVVGTSYCFLQTQMEDDINAQCHYHIISAGLALCSHVSRERFRPGQEEAVLNFDERHCSRLDSSMLLKTVYEEPATWALFTICASLMRRTILTSQSSDREPRDVLDDSSPILVKLLHKLEGVEITDWPTFEQFLSRYAYPPHLPSFRNRCYALWAQLMERPEHRQSLGAMSSTSPTQSSLSSTSSSSAAESDALTLRIKSSARYRQDIQHPTAVLSD